MSGPILPRSLFCVSSVFDLWLTNCPSFLPPFTSGRRGGDDYPAWLFVRAAIGGDRDPAVFLFGVANADVPAGGVDAGEFREQSAQVLAFEPGAAREGEVFHVRRPGDVIGLDGAFALNHVVDSGGGGR